MTDVFSRLQESELVYYIQSSRKEPSRVQASQCWCTVTWNELGHSFTCDDWSWQYLLWEDLGRWSLHSDVGIYSCPRTVCFWACAWGRSPLDVYTYLHYWLCSRSRKLIKKNLQHNLMRNKTPSLLLYPPSTLLIRLPRWHSGKDSICQCRRCKRHSLIPGPGRCPRIRNSNPLQYSCLENFRDREAWWTTVHEITKRQTVLNTHTHSVDKFISVLVVK